MIKLINKRSAHALSLDVNRTMLLKSKRSAHALSLDVNRTMFVKSKRSQMKIQQTAFMLIAVTLFFVLVGLFVVGIVFSNLKSSADIKEQKGALMLVSKLANSPEFSCENAFGINDGNCLDFDKIMALKNYIGNYENFWGISGIEIRKIYPWQENSIECTKTNYLNCNKITVIKSEGGTGVSNFASLCRKSQGVKTTQDICEMAKIIVIYGK